MVAFNSAIHNQIIAIPTHKLLLKYIPHNNIYFSSNSCSVHTCSGITFLYREGLNYLLEYNRSTDTNLPWFLMIITREISEGEENTIELITKLMCSLIMPWQFSIFT